MRAEFNGAGNHPQRKLGLDGTEQPGGQCAACKYRHSRDGLAALQFWRNAGEITEEVRGAVTGADVIQLERKGNSYSMSVARYGETFEVVQISEIELGEDVFVGLFGCAHEEDSIEQATSRMCGSSSGNRGLRAWPGSFREPPGSAGCSKRPAENHFQRRECVRGTKLDT